MHKNQGESNGTDDFDRLAYTQPVTQVSVGDQFVIAVPLYSLSGSFMDFTSNWTASFPQLLTEPIPQTFTPHKETKYRKPNVEELLNNEFAKSLMFFK